MGFFECAQSLFELFDANGDLFGRVSRRLDLIGGFHQGREPGWPYEPGRFEGGTFGGDDRERFARLRRVILANHLDRDRGLRQNSIELVGHLGGGTDRDPVDGENAVAWPESRLVGGRVGDHAIKSRSLRFGKALVSGRGIGGIRHRDTEISAIDPSL